MTKSETHAEWIVARLTESGINATLVSAQQSDRRFGSAVAICQMDWLLLRFLRDRGQDFLDIAIVEMPKQFYQFHAVEVAMDWKTIEQVLARLEPESLIAVINRVKVNFDALKTAFDVDQRQTTMAALTKVKAALEKATMERLKQ